MDNRCITLAIPYYNNISFLEQTLRSITKQTDPHFKVIISDDASLEPAQDLAASILKGLEYTYIRNETNVGMVKNWNKCVENTHTELITLLHADDCLHASYVEFMRKAFTKHKDSAAIFCGAHIIDGKGQPVFSFPDFIKKFLIPSPDEEVILSGESGAVALLRGNFIMCPTMCYKTAILKTHPFNARWKQVQDLELFLRLLRDKQLLVGVPDKLYYYRRHSTNATESQTKNNLRFREEFALYHEVASTSRTLGWNKAARTAQRATIIRLNILYTLFINILKGNFHGINARLKLVFMRLSGRKELM